LNCGVVIDINNFSGLTKYYHKEFLLQEERTQHRIYADEVSLADEDTRQFILARARQEHMNRTVIF